MGQEQSGYLQDGELGGAGMAAQTDDQMDWCEIVRNSPAVLAQERDCVQQSVETARHLLAVAHQGCPNFSLDSPCKTTGRLCDGCIPPRWRGEAVPP